MDKKTYVNNYNTKKNYINNVTYTQAYKKKPFYVKYLAVIFVVLGFFLLALTINTKGSQALPNDSDINFDMDWSDVGITLDQQTEDMLSKIRVHYDSDYNKNLVDNGVFNRFINIAQDVSAFGEKDMWTFNLFENSNKFLIAINKIVSIAAFPVQFAINIVELLFNVVSHLLGYDFGNIKYSSGKIDWRT